MRTNVASGFLSGIASVMLAGCSHFFPSTDGDQERYANATTMTVTLHSKARQVLEEVPAESAMERFEMLDFNGRTISYVAFTDTKYGALIFIDQTLWGTLTHEQANAFYSCRGYLTAMQRHWARDAQEWGASLVAAAKPANSVKLEFSGRSSAHSIREVVKNNPFLAHMKALVSMGSNPLGIFRTLDKMRDNVLAKEKYENALKGLSAIRPGMNEGEVAEVVAPEDVSFTEDGMVMAYPTLLVEYFVSEGVVKVIQQPSFYYLSRTQLALFYVPHTQWTKCTPDSWQGALTRKRITEKERAAKYRAQQPYEFSTKVPQYPSGTND